MSDDLVQAAIDHALAGGRYVFAIHGRSQRWRYRNQQRRRRRESPRRGPYCVPVPQQFSITEFSKPENLRHAFGILRAEGGPAPGIDDLTYDDFSPGEIWQALRQVSRAILDRTYRPHATELIRIPKPDRRFRELHLLIVIDRAVAKALQLALAPYWCSVLHHLRRSVWEIYAEMEHVIRVQGRYILATDDVRDCFPSFPIDLVLECHRQHISQPDLLGLVETVIRGHNGPNHTRGLDQGMPYSPVAAELTLHTSLDRQYYAADPGHPPLFRYVDNVQILSSGAQEGQQALETIQHILEPLQMTLKGTDGDPIDIRDPNHGHPVLGLIPVWERDHLIFSLPRTALQKLEEGLTGALLKPNPLSVAKQVVSGWTGAIGPVFLDQDAHHIVRHVMDCAAGCGYRELSREELLEAANQARNRWLDVRHRMELRRQEVLRP